MQSLVQNADYLLCLSLETTKTASNIRRMFATPNDRLSQLSGGAKQESAPVISDIGSYYNSNAASIPRVVNLDWCICAVKEFKVLEQQSVIVNPGCPIDAATAQQSRVTQELVQSQGVPLGQALDKLTSSLNSTVGNGKFRVCSFGDWPVRYALQLDAKRCGITVPASLTNNFVNALELHYDVNPSGKPVGIDIADFLRVNELEAIASQASEPVAKSTGASLVRVLNRMVRTAKGQDIAKGDSTQESKDGKRRSRSRSRDNQESTDAAMASAGPKSVGDVSFQPDALVAAKLRGMPWRVEESEIEAFLEGFAWVRDSIRIGELQGGRRTGQGSVLFESPAEAARFIEEKEGEYIGPRFVQLHELTYKQWEGFMEDQLGCITVDLKKILMQEHMDRTVRLRGLPRDVDKAKIKEFFDGFELDDEAIHIEQRFGRKNGWALVYLKDTDEQQRARQELNKQYIGERYVDVMLPRPEDCGDFVEECYD